MLRPSSSRGCDFARDYQLMRMASMERRGRAIVDGDGWVGYASARSTMKDVDSGQGTASSGRSNLNAFELFGEALRERPLGASAGLIAEYGMFASALVLAGSLYATRVPLAAVDRALGLRLRERFIELIARVSPG